MIHCSFKKERTTSVNASEAGVASTDSHVRRTSRSPCLYSRLRIFAFLKLEITSSTIILSTNYTLIESQRKYRVVLFQNVH